MSQVNNEHTMQALLLENYGQPYRLTILPRPVAGPGQVLVQIKASGINPLDLKIMAGQAAHAHRVLPAIPGLDLAGVVVATGEGVTAFKAGDEVFGLTGGVGDIPGSLAEYAAVDAVLLAIKPAALTMREAAAIPLGFITAWEGLADRAAVHAGQKVLIHGGQGGVGHLAIQLARTKGPTVYATGSPNSKAYIESLGAIAIDYTSTLPADYVAAYTNGEGFDIIYDTVGGSTLDDAFAAVKTYTGHVVSALGWGTHKLAPLSFRGATYSGVFTLIPLLTAKGKAHHGDIMREAAMLADAGQLFPLLHPEHFTMQTITAAYAAATAKTIPGKVVIDIGK